MSDLPEYVVRGGAQTFAPPILAQGTHMTCFGLRAAPKALQAIADRYLNGPASRQTDLRYHAVGNLVFLAHAPMDHISVTSAVDRDKGWMKETDVAFWMLLVSGRGSGANFKPESIAWFMPYVWVDVTTAVATGREVFGFPKEMSWLKGPSSPSDPLFLELSTMVLPKYTPETEIVKQPLLRIAKKNVHESAIGEAFEGAEDLVEAIAGAFHSDEKGVEVGGMGFWINLLELLARGDVPLVFLKEFRDVANPQRACYQRVVGAPCVVKKFHGGYPLLGGYDVTMIDYQSHPLAKDFGFGTPSGGQLTLQSQLTFHVNFDFQLDLGQEVK